MFLLAFHIVAVGLIIVFVWGIAYPMGRRAGERQIRRRLGLPPHGDLPAVTPVPASEPAAGSGGQ